MGQYAGRVPGRPDFPEGARLQQVSSGGGSDLEIRMYQSGSIFGVQLFNGKSLKKKIMKILYFFGFGSFSGSEICFLTFFK